MRRSAVALAASVLLLGPAVLSFFAGGYFDGPRLVATLVAWALVLVVALCAPRVLPSNWPGLVALAGLALITGWTALSFAWAPLAAPATDNLVRNLMYLGALLAAIALLRDRAAARAVEPILALGAFAAIGYGISARLLPGAIDHLFSVKGGGRLEQPITYWNAEGALASMGLVLCVRLAGDVTRALAVRVAAAGGSVVLGLGLYLTYSRGAIAAGIMGSSSCSRRFRTARSCAPWGPRSRVSPSSWRSRGASRRGLRGGRSRPARAGRGGDVSDPRGHAARGDGAERVDRRGGSAGRRAAGEFPGRAPPAGAGRRGAGSVSRDSSAAGWPSAASRRRAGARCA